MPLGITQNLSTCRIILAGENPDRKTVRKTDSRASKQANSQADGQADRQADTRTTCVDILPCQQIVGFTRWCFIVPLLLIRRGRLPCHLKVRIVVVVTVAVGAWLWLRLVRSLWVWMLEVDVEGEDLNVGARGKAQQAVGSTHCTLACRSSRCHRSRKCTSMFALERQ